MSQVYETEYVKVWIEDGILQGIYKEGVHITLDAARKIVQGRVAFQGNVLLPAVMELQEIGSIDPDARAYLGTEEAGKNMSAIALVTDSPFMNIVSNMYIYFNRPPLPIKLFAKKDEALKWVQQFKKKNDGADGSGGAASRADKLYAL
jgi:hypothetical protein